MKRGATDHPKMYELAKLMNIPHALAVGYMELLWHFTSRYAPQGDIGRHTDERIAKACHYQGRASRLVSAMCAAGWLEVCPRYRLRVHDWGDHADQGVQRALKAKGLDFVSVTQEKTSSSANQELAHLSLALPKPLPEPSRVVDSFDLETAFEELWDAYPAKGRTKKPMSQQYYVEAVATLPNDSQPAMHARIIAPVLPGGKWAKSANWAKGYVQGLAVYLNQQQWLESPESAGAESTPGNYDHLPLGFTAEEKAKMERVARERAEDGLV